MTPGSTNPPNPPPNNPPYTPQDRPSIDLSHGVSTDLLDAFLDGLLSPEEALLVGRALEKEAASKSTMQLQQGIDRVLREQFHGTANIQLNLPASTASTPIPSRPAATVQDAPLKFKAAPAETTSKHSLFRRALVSIAAMVVVTVGTLWGTGIIETGMLGFTPQGLVSPGTVYAKKVAAGFEPAWKCTTDEEFIETSEKAFAQALLVAASPGIEVVGWAYYDSVLSADTYQLLVKVNTQPVIVFIDHKDKARYLSAPSGMHIHKRVLGNVVMYELTASKNPQVLELFYDPTQGGPPGNCAVPKK